MAYNPNEKEHVVMVHNGIISARYNYSMIQERIFNYTLMYLQKYYNEIRAGQPMHQLDLFNQSTNIIDIPIRLSAISDPDEYNYVRRSAIKICQIIVEVEIKDKGNKYWHTFQGLFNKVITNIDGKLRNNQCTCQMSYEVAQYLLSLEIRKDGKPINFTQFKYEVCQLFKNKYAARMYKILCSWQSRPSFYIEFEELKNRFGLKGKYERIESFKRRILLPIQLELMEEADLWFDSNEADFDVTNQAGQVIGFNIGIHRINETVNYDAKRQAIITMFVMEYGFTTANLKEIMHIIDNMQSWKAMWHILEFKIRPRIKAGNINKKSSIPVYIIKSLTEKFPAPAAK